MTTIAKEINPRTDTATGQTSIDLSQARQILESQSCRLRRSLADSQTHYGPDAHPTFDDGDDDIYVGTLSADLATSALLDIGYVALPLRPGIDKFAKVLNTTG